MKTKGIIFFERVSHKFNKIVLMEKISQKLKLSLVTIRNDIAWNTLKFATKRSTVRCPAEKKLKHFF